MRVSFLLLALVFCTCTFIFGQPNKAKDLAERSVTLFLEAKFNQAFELAEAAISADNRAALAYSVRGRIFLIRNRDEKARADLLKAVDLEPTGGLHNAFLAWYFFVTDARVPETRKLAQTGANLVVSILKNPKNASELFARSLAFSIIGKDTEAIADLNAAANNNPRLAALIKRRGDIYRQKSETDAALADYEKAIALNPGYIYAYHGRAFIFEGKKQFDLALAEYNKAINAEPGAAENYYQRGVFYYDRGQYDLALTDYTKTIELDPAHSNAFNNRGNIYQYIRSQGSTALSDYQDAIRANSFNKYPYYNIGFLQLGVKAFDQAVEYFTKTLAIDPKFTPAYIGRGRSYQSAGRFNLAIADYNRAIEIAPQEVDGYFHRGRTYYDMAEFNLAIENYTRAIEVSPTSDGAYFNRGLIYYEEKQEFEQAIADFSKAIEIAPQNLDAYFMRANVYDSMGRGDQAEADKRKFKQLGGSKTRRRSLFPNAVFDADLAKRILGGGNSVVSGKACAIADGRKFRPNNVRVALYPVTPYLEAWHKLRKSKENRETGVYLSAQANRYRFETATDAEGKFAFRGLKPGRYFVQIIFNFSYWDSRRVWTGSETTQNGPVRTTTNYYYDEEFVVSDSERLEDFFEIKTDGDTKNITLKNKLLATCSSWW